MSKASRRRQMRRAEFLAQLAAEDPRRFSAEWTKRLESWSLEACRNIRELRDEAGRPILSNSQLIAYVDDQLASCGPQAYELESRNTREILLNESAVALSSAVDRRLYRVTNTRETCDHAALHRTRRLRKRR